jgi:hypothetical protein
MGKSREPTPASALATDADQHLDAFALGAVRHGRQFTEANLFVGDVAELTRVHVVEVMMRVRRGIVELARAPNRFSVLYTVALDTLLPASRSRSMIWSADMC